MATSFQQWSVLGNTHIQTTTGPYDYMAHPAKSRLQPLHLKGNQVAALFWGENAFTCLGDCGVDLFQGNTTTATTILTV